ncbi:hypothetical protein BZG36_03937, partial [Bifiguratus adelaidae]
MKFGSQLREQMRPEWQNDYFQYNALKKRLKENEQAFTEKDESEFVEALDKELEK